MSAVITKPVRPNASSLSPSSLCLALDYDAHQIGRSEIVHADRFEWLGRLPESSLHAVVTDPPYGVKEFEAEQLDKRASGAGGVWRIPRLTATFGCPCRASLP